MADLILRPVSDSTLAHSCSSGSSGWALINEATADDDTGYIYQSISGTSSSSQTSVFKVSGTVSNKIRISSLNLFIRGRTTKGEDNDTATLAYNVYFNGVEGTSGSGSFSTSYGNFNKTYNASDFGFANTMFDSFDAANIVVHVQTTGKKKANKNDDFQNRVTQVYITATYEEITNPTYACSTLAGEGIQSASVSASSVVSGESCTFTAALKSNYDIFDGWYSDSGYTNLVSAANPYTIAITADTTLYTKASRSQFTMAVGEAEHGTASVSAATALYGDSVIYTFTPEDDTWELYGWYSDSGLTTLVSEANPYTFTAMNDVMLYPRVGKKRYTIKYGRATDVINGSTFEINIIVVDFINLTRDEINCLRTGDYDSIDSSKIVARDSISGSNITSASWKTIQCPYDMYVSVYLPEMKHVVLVSDYQYVTDGNTALTYWPYYWFQPTANTTISSYSSSKNHWCICSAVAKDGIAYAYATTPTYQGQQAVFEAELSPGYSFQGWYSDEACTMLVSSDNPYKPTTPKYTTDSASQTSLTLYAKAQKVGEATGIYLKQNGAYTQAQAVYKKINGMWTTTDKTAIDTTKKYSLIKT